MVENFVLSLECFPWVAGGTWDIFVGMSRTPCCPRKEGLGGGLAEKTGKGLAKGWRRVGAGLAKGWHRVGEGLAGFLATSNFAILEAPV